MGTQAWGGFRNATLRCLLSPCASSRLRSRRGLLLQCVDLLRKLVRSVAARSERGRAKVVGRCALVGESRASGPRQKHFRPLLGFLLQEESSFRRGGDEFSLRR